jgi:hypothetical protein
MISNPIKAVAPAISSAQPEPTVERLAYSAKEAAEALGVSSVTLWRLAKRGKLQPIPGLRHRLYSIAALRRFAERGVA